MAERVIVVAFSGNVGACKTTLMTQIEELTKDGTYVSKNGKEHRVTVVNYVEPFFSDPVFLDLLEKSYSNPKDYSLVFQLAVLYWQMSHAEQYKQSRSKSSSSADKDYTSTKIILVERCTQDGAVFMAQKIEQGHIIKESSSVYDMWAQKHGLIPDIYIYAETDPKECHRRVSERKRMDSDFISLEYLEGLHGLYEQMFSEIDKKEIPVLRVPIPYVEKDDVSPNTREETSQTIGCKILDHLLENEVEHKQHPYISHLSLKSHN